jgi:hypothetical protein
MATVDELIIEIKAETRQLKKGLDEVNKKLSVTKKAANGAATMVRRIGIIGAVYFAGKLAKQVAQTGSTFEDLRVTLNGVFGSIEAGEEALDRILEFGQKTPLQTETVTKAFIALKSAGIEPTERMLMAFAATASVTTDQLGAFEAFIRVTQRSASGGIGLEELNMIADRGIDVFGILKRQLNLNRNEIQAFGKTSEGAAKIIDTLVESLDQEFGDQLVKKLDNLSTKTSNLKDAFSQLGDVIFDKTGFGNLIKGGLDVLTSSVIRSTKKIEEAFDREFIGPPEPAPKQIKSAREQMRDEIINFESDFRKLSEDTADPLIEINRQLQLIKEVSASQQEMDFLGTTPEELATITEHLNDLAKEATDTGNTISEVLAQSISDSAQAFTSTFVDAIASGQSALSSFRNFAEDIVKQIITTFLQMAVVNKILNSVFGSFMGTPLDTFSFGKAGGGAVQAGQPTLVGERGAEIFVPNSSGRIMNNADSMSAMGGGSGVTVNQSINFSTGVVPTVRAEVMRMMPQISDSTKAAVIEASQRGGRFRKALAGA